MSEPTRSRRQNIPDVLDKARLLVINVLEMETLQSIETVSPQEAEESPVAMRDHT